MKEISFHIDHLDPLGQGVCKKGKDIYFIGKTLPGEKGQAFVLKKRKGVYKAHVHTIDSPSSKRISPRCPHYTECPACHFLHCSYEDEIAFKKKTLARYLKELSIAEKIIEIIPAFARDGYRNRVQFHYDTQKNKIGYLDVLHENIIEVPNCLLMSTSLKKHVDESLKKKRWSIDARKLGKMKGHVEYFQRGSKTLTSYNHPYSKGGFVQVNTPMNDVLKKNLYSHLWGNVVELFAGDGGLTENYKEGEVCCIDFYSQEKKGNNPLFLSLDLYRKHSLDDYLSLERPPSGIGSLLLNPPRSGFFYLRDWVERLNPKRVVYISCHPATMVRDLKNIKGSVQAVYLIDFFPSTYHFETMAVIDMK